MEYRILERHYEYGVLQRAEVIGDGFQSFNAVYLAVHAEISKRLIIGSALIIHLVVECLNSVAPGYTEEIIPVMQLYIDTSPQSIFFLKP